MRRAARQGRQLPDVRASAPRVSGLWGKASGLDEGQFVHLVVVVAVADGAAAQENNSVQELREKIKQFLASQGMIKGHSGGGVRPADQDPSVLNLSTDPNSLPGNLPGPVSSSTLSPGSEHTRHAHMAQTSAVRDRPPQPHDHLAHFPPLPGGQPFPPPPGQGVHVLFSMDHQASRTAPLGHGQSLQPLVAHHPTMPMPPVHLDPELAYMPPSYGQPAAQQQQQHQHQHQHQQSSRPTLSSIPAPPC